LYDYNPKIKKETDTLKYYNKKLSRCRGWKNEKFRDEYKNDSSVKPSNAYKHLTIKANKLNRKKQRQRIYYYHKIHAELSSTYQVIGIEGIKVKDMQFSKKTANKTNKQKRGHNRRLNEVALYDFLSGLKYKSEWYGNSIVQLGQYEPSTIICSSCGHKIDKLPVNRRSWHCPRCHTHHDRDENAASVIENKARIMANLA
jgi:putative transposase